MIYAHYNVPRTKLPYWHPSTNRPKFYTLYPSKPSPQVWILRKPFLRTDFSHFWPSMLYVRGLDSAGLKYYPYRGSGRLDSVSSAIRIKFMKTAFVQVQVQVQSRLRLDGMTKVAAIDWKLCVAVLALNITWLEWDHVIKNYCYYYVLFNGLSRILPGSF